MNDEPVTRTSAVLIAPSNALKPEGGGVQQAARQYQEVLQHAGCDLSVFPYDFDQTLSRRIQRKLSPDVLTAEFPSSKIVPACSLIEARAAQLVFFGFHISEELSARIRSASPGVRQVLLSQGVESIDYCVAQRARRPQRRRRTFGRSAATMLGRQLLRESRQRLLLDAVITLSPLEVEVEKWLGVSRALWLPQAVIGSPLHQKPIDGRVGCVSTLDHPPNYDGLERLLEAMSGSCPRHLRFRLIGSPAEIGAQLQARFHFVDYLGPLPDDQLTEEVATWCCFVHPLFVYAKGCSTKVAVAVGWGVPIATTEFGVRGYSWSSDILPTARTPSELAHEVVNRSSADGYTHYKHQTEQIRQRMPTVEQLGRLVASFLGDMRRNGTVRPANGASGL